MKVRLPLLFLFACAIFNLADSQVSGIKYVPGDYATIAGAVNAINTTGISGSVEIHVACGHTEVAPSGGIILKFQAGVLPANRTSALQGLIIRRNPLTSGANPIVSAFTGTKDFNSTTGYDGVFLIVGVDYLTLYGIDISESLGNSNTTQWMEMGYGILRESVTNGSQNIVFRSCRVVLSNTYADNWANGCGARGSVGFFSGPMTEVSSSLLTTSGASVSGTNSNLTFYRNIAENVQSGFFILGFADVSSPYTYYDQTNKVGDLFWGGNEVYNYKQYGIYSKYQEGMSVIQNTINNEQNGTSASGSIYGVFNDVSVDSDISISENVIMLVAGGYDGDCMAVYDKTSGTGTLTVADNNITLQGGGNYLINFSAIIRPNGFPRNNVSITGNTFADFYVTYGAVTQYFFFGNLDNVIGNLVFQNNSTNGNIDLYSIGNSTNYCYFNSSASMSSGNVTVSDNFFDRITRPNANSLGLELISEIAGIVGNTITKIVENNELRRIQSNTGTMHGFRVNYGQTLTQFTQNLIYNCSGADVFIGCNIAGCNTLARYNVVRDNSALTQLKGIYLSGNPFGTVLENEVYNLTISNALGINGPSHGIYVESYTSAGVTVSKNKVYNISIDAGSSVSSISAIEVHGSTAASVSNVTNNLVADVSIINATGPLCLYGIQCRRGTHNVYHNTVALGYGGILTTPSTNFGVAGVSYSAQSTLDLRNNIIYVNAQQKGTGVVSALQRAAGTSGTAPANFASTSGFNIYYAPNVSNSFLYSEGVSTTTVVNAYNLTNDLLSNSTNCSLYKVFMGGGREDSTATEIPPFIGSGTIVNKYSLTPGATSYAESGGQLLGAVTDDHNGTSRPNNGVSNRPDIGFEEFAGVKNAFSACSLPVELISYEAYKIEGDVKLEWITASERNSSHFFIERSLDGTEWEFVATVKAAGNSSEFRAYSVFDRDLPAGIVYYRLYQVDIDGAVNFEGIRSVEMGSLNVVTVYPNPAGDWIFVEAGNEITSIDVLDLTGRQIISSKYLQINVGCIPFGRYFIKCWASDGSFMVAPFMKN